MLMRESQNGGPTRWRASSAEQTLGDVVKRPNSPPCETASQGQRVLRLTALFRRIFC